MKTFQRGRPVEQRMAVDGQRLKALRRARGWPAWELAGRIAVRLGMVRAPSTTAVYDWESEACRPSAAVVRTLAKLFHVHASSFLRKKP